MDGCIPASVPAVVQDPELSQQLLTELHLLPRGMVRGGVVPGATASWRGWPAASI